MPIRLKMFSTIFMHQKQALAPLLVAPKKMALLVVVLNTILSSRKLGAFGKMRNNVAILGKLKMK